VNVLLKEDQGTRAVFALDLKVFWRSAWRAYKCLGMNICLTTRSQAFTTRLDGGNYLGITTRFKSVHQAFRCNVRRTTDKSGYIRLSPMTGDRKASHESRSVYQSSTDHPGSSDPNPEQTTGFQRLHRSSMTIGDVGGPLILYLQKIMAKIIE
jgi:hypothetical protein